MQQLIDEHSQVDPTYVEDFLLTYRTFLVNPQEIASKLLTWFNDPDKRAKVSVSQALEIGCNAFFAIWYYEETIIVVTGNEKKSHIIFPVYMYIYWYLY